MIIAIDGPAAAGKGTLALRLADHFGLALLDTGRLYRAVGVKLARLGLSASDVEAAVALAHEVTAVDLDDRELRSDAAANAASRVAAMPEVRAALVEFQRTFAMNPPGGAKGAVLDGRDIGTVVCPDADIKLFVTARIEVRAERRVKELRERGLKAIYDRVLHEMMERDARDTERDVSPLVPAEDSLVIDTSDLDATAALDLAVKHVSSRKLSG
ncbi:MAG TPA: (d)CMP kinase [Rhodospirillales bacterium]|nr:(d)CMP kinase [Rhodospirillales bacterium]